MSVYRFCQWVCNLRPESWELDLDLGIKSGNILPGDRVIIRYPDGGNDEFHVLHNGDLV